MRALKIVLLLVALSAAQAEAAGLLVVHSQPTATVYLDDRAMGVTPVTIRNLEAGNHQLRMVDPSTNKVQLYHFYVYNRVDVAKEVDATFRPADPAVLVIHSGYNIATKEVGYRYEDATSRNRITPVDSNRHIRTSRNKVRIRNTALGVGTLGLIVGSGPLTALGFGGAIVNEVTNH